MAIERRPFQGVLNILSFNRHFYVIGLLVLASIIAAGLILHVKHLYLLIVVIAFVYGLCAPLIVSAYVYDLSGYYNFNWLHKLALNPKAEHIVNINAGFDETSFILEDHFPEAKISVFDFYNASQHTEPAIVRARKVSLTYPDTQVIETGNIPVSDQSADLVFLLSAAHEIRSNEEKVVFLKECRRICKPGGKVIMVEHLRDLPNFLAFTIGFTHFFSAPTWRKAFMQAGFSKIDETKFTPFMSVFTVTP